MTALPNDATILAAAPTTASGGTTANSDSLNTSLTQLRNALAQPTLAAQDDLAPTADTAVYFTGTTTAALYSLVAFGRSLAGAASAAAARTLLGLGSLATQSAVAIGNITATGTPSSATFLRGDGTWNVPAGAGGGGALASKNTVATADIDPQAVTYSRVQNVAANSVPANPTGSAATVQEIAAPAFGRSLLAAVDQATAQTILGLGAGGAISNDSVPPQMLAAKDPSNLVHDPKLELAATLASIWSLSDATNITRVAITLNVAALHALNFAPGLASDLNARVLPAASLQVLAGEQYEIKFDFATSGAAGGASVVQVGLEFTLKDGSTSFLFVAGAPTGTWQPTSGTVTVPATAVTANITVRRPANSDTVAYRVTALSVRRLGQSTLLAGSTVPAHRFLEQAPKTTNYTLAGSDSGTQIPINVASGTVTVPAFATLGAGFEVRLRATQAFTIDGPGSTNPGVLAGQVVTVYTSAASSTVEMLPVATPTTL